MNFTFEAGRAQVPEVREHLLAAIVELASRADWDGLEMDWQRHAFHLPADFAYTLRYGPRPPGAAKRP